MDVGETLGTFEGLYVNTEKGLATGCLDGWEGRTVGIVGLIDGAKVGVGVVGSRVKTVGVIDRYYIAMILTQHRCIGCRRRP